MKPCEGPQVPLSAQEFAYQHLILIRGFGPSAARKQPLRPQILFLTCFMATSREKLSLTSKQNIKEGIEGRPVQWYKEVFEIVFPELDRDVANKMWEKELKDKKEHRKKREQKKKEEEEEESGEDDD
jgi:hypothetical protein